MAYGLDFVVLNTKFQAYSPVPRRTLEGTRLLHASTSDLYTPPVAAPGYVPFLATRRSTLSVCIYDIHMCIYIYIYIVHTYCGPDKGSLAVHLSCVAKMPVNAGTL